MSDQEMEHIKQMANQIAANLSFHDDAEARIADHLTRFWAPLMRERLSACIAHGGEGLDEKVIAAAQLIKQK